MWQFQVCVVKAKVGESFSSVVLLGALCTRNNRRGEVKKGKKKRKG